MRKFFTLFFIAVVFFLNNAKANETEPNNTPAQANTLALNGSNSGAITAGDADWFKVTTNSDGQLNFTFTSDGNNVTAVLYDNNGTIVLTSGTTAGTTTISQDGLAVGTYYIQLYAYYSEQTLNYTISNNLVVATVANDAEPDSNRATALTLPLNSTKTGHINYYYNNHRDSTDWYKVTTDADGLLQFTLTSNNGSNVSAYLFDNDGTTSLGNLTTAGTSVLNTDGLAAGTYYVQINSYYNNQFEPYTLTDSLFKPSQSNDAEPDSTKATALSLPLNATTEGHINYYYNTHRDSTDWYKITTDADGLLQLKLTSNNGSNVSAYLFDNNGTTSLGNVTTAGTNYLNTDGLAAGTYYVQINSYYNNQFEPYTLTDSLFKPSQADDAEPDSSRATALTLAQNSTTTGHINYYYNNHRDTLDFYKITTNADGLLQLKLTSQNGSNISAYLFDNDGTTILGNVTTAGTNYLNTDGLAAGTYYVQINSYYNNQFEPYTLTDSLFTYNANDTIPNKYAAQASTIPANRTVTGHTDFYYNLQRDSTDWWKINYTGSGNMNLYFNLLPNINNGGITNVTLQVYKDTAATPLYQFTTASAANTYNLSSLSQGYYYIRITSYYNNQFEAYSITDSFTQVNKATVSLLKAASPNICGSDSLTYKLGASHSPYAVRLYRDSKLYDSLTTTSDTATFIGLNDGTYYATVYGDGATDSAYSKSVTSQLLPPFPTMLTTANVGVHSAAFNWLPISCVQNYQVQYKVTGSSTWTTVSSATGSSNYNLSGLTPYTMYIWHVASVDSAEGLMSGYSDTATFKTLSDTAHIALTFKGAGSGCNSDTLKFICTNSAPPYMVTLYRNSLVYGSPLSVTDTASFYNVPSGNYVATATGTGSGGSLGTSSTVQLTPPVTTGLTAAGVSASEEKLNWTALSCVSYYSVQYRLKGSATWMTVNTAKDSITLSNLLADTLYIWQVASVDSSNGQSVMSAYSSVDSFMTLNPLPVTFINFDGKLQNNAAVLNWSTATEINNKGFNVERSNDGINFNYIGFVQGNGNSSNVNYYSYIDNKIASGLNYYRLRQIDLDGKFTVSSAIRLDFTKFDWTILGNPVTNNSWIQLQLDRTANVAIQIISINGNVIQTINKGNIEKGTYSIPLNLQNAGSGMYVVKLLADKQLYLKKIIK